MGLNAKKYTCSVIETLWATPTVLRVRFRPKKKIKFEEGQFLSISFLDPNGGDKPIRRAYSFANSLEEASSDLYEICVKYQKGGAGSQFLEQLRPGDLFECSAPYGDFVYHPPKPGRGVCFICTGTGVGPLRAMALSKKFRESPPDFACCLYGARHESEILYPGSFESVGVEIVYAISQPKGEFVGYHGRITDYLKGLPADWGWHTTDFYLCGNGNMIEEVRRILMGGHGVPESSLYQEVFFANRRKINRPMTLDDLNSKKAA